MQLKISSITNLTDARYFSAVGAHYLGFCFDVLNENNISMNMTKEILSWLHEPVIVGEFGLHQTMEEIEFIAREMKLNEIQIPFCHPQKKELLFQKFLYTVDCPTEDDRPSTDLLVIKIKDVDIHDQLLKDFIFNNSVFIEADFTKENILYFVKELNPFGIQLSCKKKSKSGLSPVEEFSEILEMIGF